MSPTSTRSETAVVTTVGSCFTLPIAYSAWISIILAQFGHFHRLNPLFFFFDESRRDRSEIPGGFGLPREGEEDAGKPHLEAFPHAVEGIEAMTVDRL